MNALAPTSGMWQGNVHSFPVRVYYEDTDAGGIVYHANYLRFAERARTEMLRTLGVELSKVEEATGMLFVLQGGEVRYKKPARLDDMLLVETTLTDLGVASLRLEQLIRRDDDELMTFNAKLACSNREGKPMRMAESLHDTLAARVKEF